MSLIEAYRDLARAAREVIDATGGDAPAFMRTELAALEGAVDQAEKMDPEL